MGSGRLVSLGDQQIIHVNGCPYRVWSRGAGRPLILLHGWPVTSWHWNKLIPRLVVSGFQTHCIDLRGLGESQASGGDFSKENLALEILEVIHQLLGDEQPFSVIGHDWGGSVAIALAVQSEKVKSLVIEEEVPPGVSATISEPGFSRYPSWHGAFHRQASLAETLIAPRMSSYFEFFLRLRAEPKSLAEEDRSLFLSAYQDERRLPVYLQYYRTNARDAAFFRKMTNSRSAIPVLGLGGKFGMNEAVGESLKQLFLNVNFKLCEESGHYPAQEQSEFVASYILDFFETLKSSAE